MDPGRYPLQRGWDTNSALERYSGVREPEFRVGGSYGGRRYLDEGFSREPIYPRGAFRRELLERDYPLAPPPVLGTWPQPRRRSLEDEIALIREVRRHEKVPYLDNFRDIDNYRDVDKYHDVDSFREIDKFRGADNYHDLDNFRDYGFERNARYGGRDRETFDADEYDYRHRMLQPLREGEPVQQDF